jgi:hypothetical protein
MNKKLAQILQKSELSKQVASNQDDDDDYNEFDDSDDEDEDDLQLGASASTSKPTSNHKKKENIDYSLAKYLQKQEENKINNESKKLIEKSDERLAKMLQSEEALNYERMKQQKMIRNESKSTEIVDKSLLSTSSSTSSPSLSSPNCSPSSSLTPSMKTKIDLKKQRMDSPKLNVSFNFLFLFLVYII